MEIGMAARVHKDVPEPGLGEEVTLVTFFIVGPEYARDRMTPDAIPEEWVIGRITCKHDRQTGRCFITRLVGGDRREKLGRQASFPEAQEKAARAATRTIKQNAREHGAGAVDYILGTPAGRVNVRTERLDGNGGE